MTRVDKDQAKHAIREPVWTQLEQERTVPPGVHGRIPVFCRSARHTAGLAGARVIKAVPDKAQLPVRARALIAGKVV